MRFAFGRRDNIVGGCFYGFFCGPDFRSYGSLQFIQQRHVFKRDSKIFYIDETRISADSSKTIVDPAPVTFALFGVNEVTGVYFSAASRCYSAVFSGSYTRNFIPILCHAGSTYVDGNTGRITRTFADKPGMYDLVSKSFFVNQGTGEFLYG